MKQTKLPVYLMLLATLSASSCSNEDTPDTPYNPSNDPDAVELGITAGVALTKSAINQGTDDTNFKNIAVYAVGATTFIRGWQQLCAIYEKWKLDKYRYR